MTRAKPPKESETHEAITLARLILDRPNAFADDDLAILARQLLRAIERLDQIQRALSSPDVFE